MTGRSFRRTLILVSVALGAALSAAGGWRYARASAPLSGPIIVISIDALRADHLPAYGYDGVKTPAIDLLAANGVVFERAYSHASQTLPAHAALLTGRLPFETGVRDDAGVTLGAGERALPRLLRERGYATGAVVSGPLLRRNTGIAQGFDFFDDDLPPNPDDPTAEPGERDGGRSELIAEEWLTSSGSSRSFLFLHLNEPHRPHVPPDRFSALPPYDGEIAYADEIVGRLIHYLKTHQLYDRSTIVLLSDHGEGLGGHGEHGHGLFVYDETIRVPLIVKQESNVGAGRRVADLVQHVDVVPTILELVNAPVPDQLRGRSLKPLLEGTGQFRDRSVYSEALYGNRHFGWSALTALTDGRYRYIKAPREELYDLMVDPDERENVADRDAGTRQVVEAFRVDLARLTGEPITDSAADGSTVSAADPKDRVAIADRYRSALELAAQRRWSDAVPLLQRVVREEPAVTEVWRALAHVALLVPRHDIALDAYRHIVRLEPSEPEGYLAAAEVLLKDRRLAEARALALEGVGVSADKDARVRAGARALLARIALSQRDLDGAREQAALAQEADPGLPMPAFVEARILHDEGQYEEALPWFEQALAVSRASDAAPVTDLHFYAGDTLSRLGRHAEAEAQFADELRQFPRNTRASAGLATLYHVTGRPDESDAVIAEMLHAAPTAESYTLATRLLRSFGRPHDADTIRAEARRAANR